MPIDGIESVRRESPWLRVSEAAAYAGCGTRVLYRAVIDGRLKAVRLGGRRELRFRPEWIDKWLEGRLMNESG